MKTKWLIRSSIISLVTIAIIAPLAAGLGVQYPKPNEQKRSQGQFAQSDGFEELSIVKSSRPTLRGAIEDKRRVKDIQFLTTAELSTAPSHLGHRQPVQIAGMSRRGTISSHRITNDPVLSAFKAQPSTRLGRDIRFASSLKRKSHRSPDELNASINVNPGDGLIKTLRNLGVDDDSIKKIVPVITANYARALRPEDRVAAGWVSDDEHNDEGHLEYVSIYSSDREVYRATRRDAVGFSSVATPMVEEAMPPEVISIGEALSLELMASGVSRPEVARLLFALWDQVDLTRKISLSDQFTALLEYKDPETLTVSFLRFTTQNQTYEAYRLVIGQDRSVYFDRSGRRWGSGLISKPMGVGRLTSPFGERVHPITKSRQFHAGRDLAASTGTKIFAARDGVVEVAGSVSGYGKMVQLAHSQELSTRYAHMGRIVDGLTIDDKVEKGQLIGFVGSSGMSTGSHLHFEVRETRKAVDPATFNARLSETIEVELRPRLKNKVKDTDRRLSLGNSISSGTHI